MSVPGGLTPDKVMQCITWSEEEPSMPTACDGQAIGQAQLQLKREEAEN